MSEVADFSEFERMTVVSATEAIPVAEAATTQVTEATRRRLGRRAALLDLAEGAQPAGQYQHAEAIPLPPNFVNELIAETEIGKLLIDPGDRMTRARVVGLFEAATFDSPTAKRLPDRTYTRMSSAEPSPGESPEEWAKFIGYVFQYDHEGRNDRVITGEVEFGLMLTSKSIKAYRSTAILRDGGPILIEEPCTFDVSARQVDEFVANMEKIKWLQKQQGSGPEEPPREEMAEAA